MADPVLQSSKNPHFFQPLLPGFENFIKIPVKFFSIHIKGRSKGQSVELRSDVSKKIWKVNMEGRRLTIGWKEFATAHDLRIGDVIIFKHNGALVFHVTGFGPCFCEIQYPLSCNNDDDSDLYNDQENMEKVPKVDAEVDAEADADADTEADADANTEAVADAEADSYLAYPSRFVAHVTKSNLHCDTLFLPRKFVQFDRLSKGTSDIVLVNEGARTWVLSLRFRESSKTFYMRDGWRSFCNENGLKPGDFVKFKLKSNNNKTPLLRFCSLKSVDVFTEDRSKGKKQKTDVKIERVSSSSALHENRFLTLTVTPACIKKYRFTIPRKFFRANGMGNAGGKKIIVLDKHGVEWPVNLVMEKENKRIHLGSGVKKFIEANDIKVYESFVLELVWEEKTTLPMFKFCSKTNT